MSHYYTLPYNIMCQFSVDLIVAETSHGHSAETRKLVAAYLHGSGLSPLTNQRRALITSGRLIASGRPAVGRVQSSMRAELKQTVSAASAPYTTNPPHRSR